MITRFYAAVAAALVLFVTMMSIFYHTYTCGNLTGSPWGTLIAVFMVIGEPVPHTALTVTITPSPDSEQNILPLSFGWLGHAMTALLSIFSGVWPYSKARE
jgi:hypothetical protein